ncbi:MAG: PilZ domain-containing protein, partial [Candidatus Omnitrophica bacterium]|nr:PilZ domain-containing protein [Candidatus Omnitrophota bacterium]
PATETDMGTRKSTQSVTRDLSEQGIGIALEGPMPLHVPLEIELSVPDNSEKIRVRGKAVWVQAVRENMYRAGIYLDSFCLRPIPLALRMIKVQLKSRYEVAQ